MLSLFFSSWSLVLALILFIITWFNVPGALWAYYRLCRVASEVPGWPTHWLYGNLHQLREMDQEVIMKSCHFVYSNHHKLTRSWLGPFHLSIGIHDPTCVKELFKHSKDSNMYALLKPWLGEGLLIAEGAKWHRNRRLLTPAFHYAILKSYVSVYNSCTETLVQKWTSTSAKGEPVKLFDTVCLASLDILLQCAFSYNSDCQNSKPPYVEAVKNIILACTDRFVNPLHQIDWIYKFTGKGRRMKQLCKMIHDHANLVINQRKEALKLTGGNCSSVTDATKCRENLSKSRRLDFLDILLTAVDEDGVGLSDVEIRNEVDTFMFEGHDTTTSGICWTLYCLAKHSDHQQKVREEVNSVLAGRSSLTHDDLKELTYTYQCIKEALRLYPPVHIIFRQLDHDCEINGLLFPKGTHFRIPIRSIHHNPDVWSDPETYDPMRFTPSNSKDRDPYAYIPFSASSRNCIGQNFALNELKTVVASIIQQFRLTLDQNHKVEFVPKIILKAKNDIQVFVEPI